MPEDTAVETQATELLRTLIKNGCVNTGEAASGHEDRSVDALMFHGHDERVDTESLKLSALMWEALCRDFLG